MKATISTVLLFVVCIMQSGAAYGKEPGYVLHQDSGAAGEATVFATSKAMKIAQKNTKRVLLVKAPDWKVHFFDTAARRIFEVDAKNWKGSSSSFMEGVVSVSRFSVLSDRRVMPGSASVAGLSCTKIRMLRRGRVEQTGFLDKTELGSANYYGTAALGLPPEAIAVVQQYYRIPALTGYPIKMEIYHLGRSDAKSELDTLSCTKTTFDDAAFAVPTGFRVVKSAGDVVIGDQQELLEDMSDGLGSKFGTRK